MHSYLTMAASFQFGAGFTQNTIVGLEQATLVGDGTSMTLLAGPSGSRIDDTDSQGLGVSSTNLAAGIADPDHNKLNFVTGHPAGPRIAESVSFSFTRPGILRDLLLDGVKDETLEYMILTFPEGNAITVFDSQAEFRLGIQGFSLSDLSVVNPVQCQTEEDNLTGINYRFSAGEVFTLAYGEGDYNDVPGYKTNPNFPQFPNAVGDGARFQGAVVEVVPEPTSVLLILAVLVVSLCYPPRAIK